MQVKIRAISQVQHQSFLSTLPSASFLQLPEWGSVKIDWKSHSLGLFEDENLIGVALLLTRKLPIVGKSFGYIPEGPVLLNSSAFTGNLLKALEIYSRQEKIFLLRIGPAIPFRDWDNSVIKSALASDDATSLLETQPSVEYHEGRSLMNELKEKGWRAVISESGFSEGQPNFVFQLELKGISEAKLLEGCNQLWRRNIKKADKEGVEVSEGIRQDLVLFHQV